MSVTIIVCGGRGYKDRERIYQVLDSIHERRVIGKLIEGDCSGVDKIAGEWAKDRGVALVKCAADWKGNGRAAGPIRNAFMLTLNPDGVVAFPGGDGTADMCRQAEKAGVPVMRVTA